MIVFKKGYRDSLVLLLNKSPYDSALSIDKSNIHTYIYKYKPIERTVQPWERGHPVWLEHRGNNIGGLKKTNQWSMRCAFSGPESTHSMVICN